MLLLLQLATRRERQIIQDNRQLFLSTMRDLRRLVQRMSPDGEFRNYEWRRLQREAPRVINDFVTGFTEVLVPELVALEAPVQEFAQDYADLDTTSFVPQTEQQVLENVFIDSTKLPLLAYLIYNGRLAKDLLNKFIRTVDVGLLRGDPTPNSPTTFSRLTMRNGKVVPVVKTGSYANIASTQIKNTLDGAVWGQINQNLKIGWRGSRTHWLGLECCLGQRRRVPFVPHSTGSWFPSRRRLSRRALAARCHLCIRTADVPYFQYSPSRAMAKRGLIRKHQR